MTRKGVRQSLELTGMDWAILDAFTVDPFVTARSIADSLGAPLPKVTARIRALDRGRVSRVLAVLDLAAVGHQVCFVMLEIRGRPIEDVSAEIAVMPEVLVASTLIGGPHDLLLMVRYATNADLNEIVSNKICRIEGIDRFMVSIVLDIPSFQPRYVWFGPEPTLHTDVRQTMHDLAREFREDQLDELDRQIVAELLLNARQSINSIARKYNLNASTIRYRIRSLESRGLMRFVTVFDSAALGIQAFALFEIEPAASRLSDVLASLLKRSWQPHIFVTTGPAPIKCIMHGENIDAIKRIKSEELAQIDGIRNVTVSAFVSTHKNDGRWGHKYTQPAQQYRPLQA